MSAVAKLIPRPPDLVLNMKMNFLLFGMLYSLMYLCRKKNELTFVNRDCTASKVFPTRRIKVPSQFCPHGVSVRPIGSSHSPSSDSNPPICPTFWSSDWRSGLGNLSSTHKCHKEYNPSRGAYRKKLSYPVNFYYTKWLPVV